MSDNRDYTKTGTIQGLAEWMQSKAGAGGGGCLFVCVVRVDDLAIAGDPAHPVTRGFLCGKVARYLDRVYSPERLLYPMRRRADVSRSSSSIECIASGLAL